MNLADILDNHAERRPDRPAVVHDGGIVTHGEFAGLTRRWAAHLADRGIAAGDLVGLDLGDSVEHVIALHAIARLGAVILPMDWRWTVAEKRRVSDFFGARLVLCEAGDDLIASAVIAETAIVDDRWREAVAAADGDRPFATVDNPMLLLSLSSGTTGTPKGPVISHDQMFARFMIYFMTLGFDERTRFLCASPLYFGGSRGYSMCALHCGGTVVLFPQPFAAADLIAAARRERASHLFLVPTVLRRLLDVPGGSRRAPLLGTLDCLLSTGGALHPEERAELLARVCPGYLNFYGSTEGGGCTALLPDDPPEAASSVGRPVFSTRLEIVGDDDAPLPAGEVGHIRFRHPGTATAYHNDPERSREAFRDGWYYPGDLGWKDAAGYLFLAGRARDMIIRGGVNIHPAEIEHVLGLHDGVREAAVIGRPDREYGEQVVAFVVARDAAKPPGDDALRRHCEAGLAPYKVPREFRLLDELPKSGIGKVLKTELRERLDAV
jgi:acyl-CoA synthetase (AMP-forming)/AMP-acid ligase II